MSGSINTPPIVEKGKTCTFHFPQPPSPKTLIAKPDSNSDTLVDPQSILTKVRDKLINDTVDVSLNQLLIDTGIEHDKYLQGISNVDDVVVLKREPNECKINNYNGPVLQAWQANMDLYSICFKCLCIYVCSINAFMYVASYMMKTKRQIHELLKGVASEDRSEELITQLCFLKP